MELLPLVFTSGWASGINAYAVVVLLGLLGRFAGVDGVPAALERTDVLVAAFVLYAVEFVADKVPFVDSIWDAVHTAVRPTAGAVLGLLLTGDATSLDQAAAAATGGGAALASHAVKASLRLAVNTSPEPASNVVTSVAEDVTVAGVVTLAVFHPVAAAVVAAVLLLLGVVLAFALVRRIRRFRHAWRARSATG
ncbi:MAG: DUF4126 domain-containing protein [Actinomycetota bacterium]|nr:DUF4126 domain-containing protein [Actinomycetota bacterium]